MYALFELSVTPKCRSLNNCFFPVMPELQYVMYVVYYIYLGNVQKLREQEGDGGVSKMFTT